MGSPSRRRAVTRPGGRSRTDQPGGDNRETGQELHAHTQPDGVQCVVGGRPGAGMVPSVIRSPDGSRVRSPGTRRRRRSSRSPHPPRTVPATVLDQEVLQRETRQGHRRGNTEDHPAGRGLCPRSPDPDRQPGPAGALVAGDDDTDDPDKGDQAHDNIEARSARNQTVTVSQGAKVLLVRI